MDPVAHGRDRVRERQRPHDSSLDEGRVPQRDTREQQEKQAQTEADIAQDPLVLAMQETFDAQIVPDAISGE